LRSLADHPGVAGVLVDADADLLFTSDRAAAQVSVYRCSDETLLARIGVGAHPNGLAFDGMGGHLFSFNLGEPIGENCTASVIDLAGQRVLATIELPGRPRWALWDQATNQVYANIRDPARIVVIDAASWQICGEFAVPAEGPHGLCIDGEWMY